MIGPLSRRELLAGTAGATLGAAALACKAPATATESDRDAQLDERLAQLVDQRESVAPITPDERAARRARLGRLLAERDIGALVMEAGPTMTYLADVSWGRSERWFALVVTADGTHFWLVPAFEAARARLRIDAAGAGGEIVAWDEHVYPYVPLADELRRRDIQRVAIEPELRYVFAQGLAGEIGSANVVTGSDVRVALRGPKDTHELELLRKANELTLLAIRTVARQLEPGMNGRDIGAMMAHAHERLGMTSPWCLALLGPEAALPHGGLNERRLVPGELVLVDTGAALHGYCSDNTRTWIFDGAPSSEVERAWNVVHDAQRRAFETIRPGIACAEVDLAARAVIDSAGYGPGYRTFTHRLGHGIGLQGHEDPYFDSGSRVVLEPGMTLSDEPGIYVPGEYGVRLEDIVAVTADGADHFGTWQRSPRSPE